MKLVMEVDIVTKYGTTVRETRMVDSYAPHPDIPNTSVPVPILNDGEQLHYVLGDMVPLIIQTRS